MISTYFDQLSQDSPTMANWFGFPVSSMLRIVISRWDGQEPKTLEVEDAGASAASSVEPRSKLPAIDFCLRWNLFFKKLNGVTRAQAFHKLRASSCTRKLRASPKSSRYFKDKYMNIQQEGLHNMMGSGFQRCSGNFAQGSRKLRASKGVPAHYMPHRNP